MVASVMAEVESAMVGARPMIGVGHSRCNQSRSGTRYILLPSRHHRSRHRWRGRTCSSNQEWMVESVMADAYLGFGTAIVVMAEVESAMVGARPIVGVGHSRCNQSRGGTMQILLPSRHRRSRRRLRNWGTCLSNHE